MGDGYWLDLGSPLFWLMLAATVICLAFADQGRARVTVMGCANALFLWILGGWECVTLAAALSVLLSAVVRARSNQWPRILAIGAAMVLLFIVHKRGDFLLAIHWMKSFRGALAAMGFSYAALRSVELLRAGWDGKAPKVTGLIAFNYLFPFHMVAAGPIQAWDGFDPNEPQYPASTVPQVMAGMDRIARGLFKKFVVAQAIQVVFLTGFKAKGWYFFWEAQIHYIWLFLDFSAYSDIAVGAGTLLGIRTPENFQKPFSSRNIIVFWERWHISLSAFVRRNLFTPTLLGIMRNHPSVGPLAGGTIAFAVAFMLCGLWHGLSIRFLIWGSIHALALIGCNIYRHVLLIRLGRGGVATYMANPWVRGVAIGLTFQFVVWSLVFVQHPALAFLD